MNGLGTTRDKALWDRLVNERWDGQQPILPPDQSLKAAQRLYRKALGVKAPTVQLTSGNRFTWVRHGVLHVNPDNRRQGVRGLRSIIHDISHYAHQRLHPADAPHSRRQAALEGKLVTYALRSGFLEGKLAPKVKAEAEPKAKPDMVQKRYAAILHREAKWAVELAKAEKLLAKARRERRVYEKRHGERLGVRS